MSGELNLQNLLKNMQLIRYGDYAFCVLDDDTCKALPMLTLRKADAANVLWLQIDEG